MRAVLAVVVLGCVGCGANVEQGVTPPLVEADGTTATSEAVKLDRAGFGWNISCDGSDDVVYGLHFMLHNHRDVDCYDRDDPDIGEPDDKVMSYLGIWTGPDPSGSSPFMEMSLWKAHEVISESSSNPVDPDAVPLPHYYTAYESVLDIADIVNDASGRPISIRGSLEVEFTLGTVRGTFNAVHCPEQDYWSCS